MGVLSEWDEFSVDSLSDWEELAAGCPTGECASNRVIAWRVFDPQTGALLIASGLGLGSGSWIVRTYDPVTGAVVWTETGSSFAELAVASERGKAVARGEAVARRNP